MPEITPAIKASVGFASETGPRERNEDFAGAVFGMELPKPRRDIIAAIADGIGGSKGGRVAAETGCADFLMVFAICPKPWKSAVPEPRSSMPSIVGFFRKAAATTS